MKKLTLFLFSILTLFFIAPSYSEEKFISDFAEEVKVIDVDCIAVYYSWNTNYFLCVRNIV